MRPTSLLLGEEGWDAFQGAKCVPRPPPPGGTAMGRIPSATALDPRPDHRRCPGAASLYSPTGSSDEVGPASVPTSRGDALPGRAWSV